MKFYQDLQMQIVNECQPRGRSIDFLIGLTWKAGKCEILLQKSKISPSATDQSWQLINHGDWQNGSGNSHGIV